MGQWERIIIKNRVVFVAVFGLAAVGLACTVSNVIVAVSNWWRWCGNLQDCNSLDIWTHVARAVGIMPRDTFVTRSGAARRGHDTGEIPPAMPGKVPLPA